MLLILSIIYLFHNTRAVPISFLSRDVNTLNSTSPTQCLCPNQRSRFDILWSCLATIFACSWVSIHPNMPGPKAKWWKITLLRLELMFWALISPEVIILWAMRQWYYARRLARQYKEKGWTRTHGYFIQMGGFTLFEGTEAKGVVSPEHLATLLRHGRIEFPTITEEEIHDHSRGDGLSKALVIGQTSWFVAQCIARKAQGLTITELELVTGAFAALNGVMYYLWWNKPQNAQCSVPIYLFDEGTFTLAPSATLEHLEPIGQGAKSLLASIVSGVLVKIWSFITLSRHKWILWILQLTSKEVLQDRLMTVIRSPRTAIGAIWYRIVEMSRGSDIQPGQMQVPTFYSEAYSSETLCLATSSIAIVFGAIHCAGWFFSVPTHAELIIWRICSAIIAGLPFLVTMTITSHILRYSMPLANTSKVLTGILGSISGVCLPFYVVARLLLLAEALATLRDLPAGAYEVVVWTTFIPHI